MNPKALTLCAAITMFATMGILGEKPTQNRRDKIVRFDAAADARTVLPGSNLGSGLNP